MLGGFRLANGPERSGSIRAAFAECGYGRVLCEQRGKLSYRAATDASREFYRSRRQLEAVVNYVINLQFVAIIESAS